MTHVARLSAMPLFLRKQGFWSRLLDPLAQSGKNAGFGSLRLASATHCWSLDTRGFQFPMPSADTLALIDIAQSILERGAWTLPTWSVEEWLAEKIQEELRLACPAGQRFWRLSVFQGGIRKAG
ncbi:hypothetical protein [Bordetella trematum]|uniref:hypothetical protein n=1 Tax=Bordetella trematum TaxID=123899 RepID=UPI003AF3B7DA